MQLGQSEEITRYLSCAGMDCLISWIHGSVKVWNASTARNKEAFTRYKEGHTDKPIEDQKYAWVKQLKGHEWLSEIPSQILRNARVHWHKEHTAFIKGLRMAPKFRSIVDRNSVWITRELLSFTIVEDQLEITLFDSTNSKKRKAIFGKRFKWKYGDTQPNSIRITKQGSRFWISFSYEHICESDLLSQQDLVAELQKLPREELEASTIGIDRGITTKVAVSDGRDLGHSDNEQDQINRIEKLAKRNQRKLSKKMRGSKNRNKARLRLAKKKAKLRNIRKNRAHHISKEIAQSSDIKVICFESLGKNMTRSAKGTIENPGKNVKAKAGLNRGILSSMWGSILTFTRYKAEMGNRLVIEVPPQYTSQECPSCGHIESENRKAKEFRCKQCDYQEDADRVGSYNVKSRGINRILDGTVTKQVKASKKKSLVARKNL